MKVHAMQYHNSFREKRNQILKWTMRYMMISLCFQFKNDRVHNVVFMKNHIISISFRWLILSDFFDIYFSRLFPINPIESVSIHIHLKIINKCLCAMWCAIVNINRDIEFAIKMHLIQFIYDMNIYWIPNCYSFSNQSTVPYPEWINQNKLRWNHYLVKVDFYSVNK